MTSLEALKEEIVNCRKCPRLVQYRQEISIKKRAAYKNWDYWGRPIPGFGDSLGRLLIVGLAPAAHGGNRTGRLFTGDGSATFLMRGLHKAGFANQADSISKDDGLQLIDAFLVAAIRCAPPDNKPTPEEIVCCRPYLLEEMACLPNLKAVLALGKIGMDAYINALNSQGRKLKKPLFGHGFSYELEPGLPRLFTSYHPSQQNTLTGKLTEPMFDRMLADLRQYIDS